MKKQIEKLSSEAKSQLEKLQSVTGKYPEALNFGIYKWTAGGSEQMEGDKELGLIALHSKRVDGWLIIYLNVAFINHSCAPNAINGSFSKAFKKERAEDLKNL